MLKDAVDERCHIIHVNFQRMIVSDTPQYPKVRSEIGKSMTTVDVARDILTLFAKLGPGDLPQKNVGFWFWILPRHLSLSFRGPRKMATQSAALI
jgi:hypothetical protein